MHLDGIPIAQLRASAASAGLTRDDSLLVLDALEFATAEVQVLRGELERLRDRGTPLR